MTKNIARRFSNLMNCGRVKDALQLLSEDGQGGPLPMDSAVMDSLLIKHPKNREPLPSALIGDSSTAVQPPHPFLFDRLDAFCIRHAALQTGGAAGPSDLDAAACRCICTSFQRLLNDLCDALSAVAKRLCTSFGDPSGLSAFVCCCLIAITRLHWTSTLE